MEFDFTPRRFWRGKMRLEAIIISVAHKNYTQFWHDVEKPSDVEIVFHYENLPKRVDRKRRKQRLEKFVDLTLQNDFFMLNTFGDDQAALNNKEAVVRQVLYEWLNLHAKKEYGNLRRHLVAVEVILKE